MVVLISSASRAPFVKYLSSYVITCALALLLALLNSSRDFLVRVFVVLFFDLLPTFFYKFALSL